MPTKDRAGNFLASAGGQHAIVWDFGDGAELPVSKKESAAICVGHDCRVTALAFGPSQRDADTDQVVLLRPQTVLRQQRSVRACRQVTTLLATADESGVVLVYRIGSASARDDTPHFKAGMPSIYSPVARCSPAAQRGTDGVARLAWVGEVLHTAADSGRLRRWDVGK